MITIEGVKVTPSIQALAEGEGFNVTLQTEWFPERPNHMLRAELRNAINKAKEEDIIGWRINGHEATFADAKTRLANEMGTFTTEITTFIDNWNTAQ